MKNKLLALLAILTFCFVPATTVAQQPSQESFIMNMVLAPPTTIVGQSVSSPTGTALNTNLVGGTVAAGSYRVCVTYFSTANTETPCSVDTAASSVIITTGSTSTVIVSPPVAPIPGPISVVGYRVYIGASAGAAAAETLQTLTSAICSLSSSSTPSCSLSSPAVFTSSAGFVGGAGGPATPGTLLSYPLSNAANMALFENSTDVTQILSWTVSGTAPATCTVQLQAGTLPSTLANVGQSLTCTATGSYALPSIVPAAYFAPNISAFTGGSTTTSVTFTLYALTYPVAYYWGPATPSSACTAGTGMFVVVGTTTSTVFSCAAGTWTAVTLP